YALSEGDTHLAGDSLLSALRHRKRQRLLSGSRQQNRRIVNRHDLPNALQQGRKQVVHLDLERACAQACLCNGLQLSELLIRRLRRRALSLDPPALGDITHDGDDSELCSCIQRTQADLDGKLRAIASAAKEGKIHSHRSRMRLLHVTSAKLSM